MLLSQASTLWGPRIITGCSDSISQGYTPMSIPDCWSTDTGVQEPHSSPDTSAPHPPTFRRQPWNNTVTIRSRPEGSHKSSALGSSPAEETEHHSGRRSFEEHACRRGVSSKTEDIGWSLKGWCVALKDPVLHKPSSPHLGDATLLIPGAPRSYAGREGRESPQIPCLRIEPASPPPV